MGYIRRVDRSAAVGFCPTAPYMAAGSAASAIDMNFSTSSVLEVFRVDFAASQTDLPTAGNPVAASERFNRVSWGKTGIESKLYPLGLVAGGLEDGTVHIWDPNKVIQGADTTRSTVAKLKKHKSAVRALEFNSTAHHWLASGSTESELLIWDLTKPSIPSFLPTLKAPPMGTGVESDITHVSWNAKVQQILASCTTSGRTIVWDLRRPRPVATLIDLNSQRRCSVLQWNPEVATQVMVASDDDRSPTLQLWDLRSSVSPLKEFVGHSKGVKGMSWCPHDPYLLLSCATDGKTYCWDVTTGEVIGEMPQSQNWHLDIQWSPVTPGLFSITSFDGTVGISSLQQFVGPPTQDQYGQYEQTAGPLKRTPAWLKRPVGVTFGFGGKLATFSHKPGTVQDPQTGQMKQIEKAEISMQQVVTEAEAVTPSDEFDAVIQTGDRDKLHDYCSEKAKKAKGEEQATWTFLGMMFSNDAKHELLSQLGFSDILPVISAQELEAEQENGVGGQPGGAPVAPPPPPEPEAGFFDNDGADFFDNIGDDEPEKPAPAQNATPAPSPAARSQSKAGPGPNPVVLPGEKENEIQRALLVGNYEAAVEACFDAKRPADALMIAHAGGDALYAKASKRYMETAPRPFMALLSAVVDSNFESLVQSRPVSQWKETLALLVAYINDTDTWVTLCDTLGIRLVQAGMEHAATLCFICAGDVDKAVASWARMKKMNVSGMQDVIEKAIILGMATNEQEASQGLCEMVHNFASILASQGSMDQALAYLSKIPGEPSESVSLLRDRIMGTGAGAAAAATIQEQDVYSGGPTHQPTGSSDYSSMGYAGYGGGYYQTSQPSPGASYQTAPPTPQYPAYSDQQYASTGYSSQAYPTQDNRGYGMGGQYMPQTPPVQQQPPAQPAPFVPQMSAHTPQVMNPAMPTPATPASPGMGRTYSSSYSAAPETAQTPSLFTPMAPQSAAGVGPGLAQPTSPAKPPSPPPPTGPPAHVSVSNVNTSKVPANQKPILVSLTNLFKNCEMVAQGPAKKREMADTSKKLGVLFWHMNEGDLSAQVVGQLMGLARAIDSGDIATALQMHAQMTQTCWEEGSAWLTALKRLLKIRQMMR